MAFNPLVWMRKHQKVMMAALVLICMVTFILSSGTLGGDFFDWLRYVFSGRSRYPEVGSVYGERIDTQEYARLRRQRMVAHAYMTLANQEAQRLVEDQVKRLDEEMKKKTGGENVFQQRMALQSTLTKLQQRQPRGQLYFGGFDRPEDVFDFL